MSSRQEAREEGRAVPVADAAPGDTARMEITATAHRQARYPGAHHADRPRHGVVPGLPGPAAASGGGSEQEGRRGGVRGPDGATEEVVPGDARVADGAGDGGGVGGVPGGAEPTGRAGSGRTARTGNPVLRDEHWVRYVLFYYFNGATAFVTSLVIMVLLMSERFYHGEGQGDGAHVHHTFVDLASLVGAYIAGTTRYASSCVYIVVITCVSFVCVIYIGEAMGGICVFVRLGRIKCMRDLAKLNWCPVPADVVTKSLPEEERRKGANKRSKRPFCQCCGSPTSPDRRDVEGQ